MNRRSNSAPDEAYDVLVIGAGQAGLALGRQLLLQHRAGQKPAKRGPTLLLVDAAPRLGTTWRHRWDSLRLFTPAAYSSLPGMPFPAPADSYPGKDEVADYLEAYQNHFEIPVRLDTRVSRLTTHLDGHHTGYRDGYLAHTPSGTIHARQVVLATGPFQRPNVPAVSDRLRRQAPEIHQLHSSQYRSPHGLPDGPVLVVGGGNSGVQIADELNRTHPTTLAVGSRLPSLPRDLAGRSVFWWLDHLGILRLPVPPPFGAWWRRRDFLIGQGYAGLRRRGVGLAGRVIGVNQGRLRCRDGSQYEPRSVVWATGYLPDFAWIDLPLIADDGWIRQSGGRTSLPGLYTVGLPWQCTAGSALLGWVGRDARLLAWDITRRLLTSP